MCVVSIRFSVLRERLGVGEKGSWLERLRARTHNPLLCAQDLEGGPPIHAICDVSKHGKGFQGDLKLHHLCLLLQLLGVGGRGTQYSPSSPRRPEGTHIEVLLSLGNLSLLA